MITRIPSSPLSSATPSPRLHPLDGVAGPSRHSSMLSGDGRDDRSRTSSTIALTITAEDEESELTEEDGEDEGEEEEEEEEEELEDKPDRDVEEDGSLGLPVKRPKRVESQSMSPSDSLTPPPPSDAVRPPPIHDSSPRIPRLQINAPMMELDEGALGAEEDEAEGEDEPEIYETVRVDDGDVLQQGLSGEEQPVGEEMLEEEADAEEEELADGEDINGDAEQEADEEEPDSPAILPMRPAGHSHSSHAPPPALAVMRNLLMLELKFAALRDRLYVERMEEAAAEEEMVLKATHPALVHLHKMLSQRRERLHEVASRRHQAALAELVKAREADKQHVWTWWTDERDRLHWDEIEQTWNKRRRLAREKNEIETPKIVRPIPRPKAEKSQRIFDWSEGTTPAKLGAEEAGHDLEIMKNRGAVQISRHASPAHFPQPGPLPQYASAGPSTIPPGSDAVRHHHHRVYHNGTPTRTVQTPYSHAFPSSEPAALSRSASGGAPPLQWREGRTVPTTSDMFKRDMMAKEVKSETFGSAMGDALGLWAKQHDARPLGGAMEARLTNGRMNGIVKDNPTPDKMAEKANHRFPGLSEYLGAPRNEPAGGGGYSHMGKVGSILSPPKVGAGMSDRGLFTGSPNGQSAMTGPRS